MARISWGFVKGYFCYPLGHFSSFEAELWAIIKAILYAQLFFGSLLGWKVILLQLSVISKLSLYKSLRIYGRFGVFVWTSSFPLLLKFFIFTDRDCNIIADSLSKMALHASTDTWLLALLNDCTYSHILDLWSDRSSRFCYSLLFFF